jgi:hypothetical protein
LLYLYLYLRVFQVSSPQFSAGILNMVLVSLVSVTRPAPFASFFVWPSVCSETKQLTRQSQSRLGSEYPRNPSAHAATSYARSFVPNASCIRHCRSRSSWTQHTRGNAMLWGSVRCEFRRASARPSAPCSKIRTCVRIWAVGSSYFCYWYVFMLAAAFCVAKGVIYIPTFVWRTWELTECGVERGSLPCYTATGNWNNHLTTATRISGHFSTNLTEFFPWFFVSCKANARV